MKMYTALPLYENKLEAASGKYNVCFNVSLQERPYSLNLSQSCSVKSAQSLHGSYKSGRENTEISGLYFL